MEHMPTPPAPRRAVPAVLGLLVLLVATVAGCGGGGSGTTPQGFRFTADAGKVQPNDQILFSYGAGAFSQGVLIDVSPVNLSSTSVSLNGQAITLSASAPSGATYVPGTAYGFTLTPALNEHLGGPVTLRIALSSPIPVAPNAIVPDVRIYTYREKTWEPLSNTSLNDGALKVGTQASTPQNITSVTATVTYPHDLSHGDATPVNGFSQLITGTGSGGATSGTGLYAVFQASAPAPPSS